MRTIRLILVMLLLVTLSVATAMDASARGRRRSHKQKKEPVGRALFRDYCKPCHARGSANGEVTPMTLIGDQWKRFFDKKYEKTHSDLVDPNHDGKKLREVITKEQLEKIRTFAIEHAADSEHPMTCG